MNRWETQLRKGMVELAVLAEVSRGETYGYRVVERLKSPGGLELTESTAYPVLTRLAREGLLSVRVEPSPSGPPRRYYRLTGDGRRQLRLMAERWKVMADSLSNLLEGAQE